MKQVKIINFKANKFGVFEAINLDFDQFKKGIIAIKGNAGAGKSTIQKGIRLSTQGRDVLADPDQYGDEWEAETQLIDGDRKVFIGAVKKSGESVSYKLYEKDSNGKKVMTPIIDGVKATPAKYMDTLTTELTFGIKDFLDENNTVHKKFMFKLFRPELEKLGVIFDKKASGYEDSILGQLDKLTESRDQLRALCNSKGAFVESLEREGYDKGYLETLKIQSISDLEKQKNTILIEKGKDEGGNNAAYQEALSMAKEKGRKIVDKIRDLKEKLLGDYRKKKEEYDNCEKHNKSITETRENILSELNKATFISASDYRSITDIINSSASAAMKEVSLPEQPKCPEFIDGKLSAGANPENYPLFIDLILGYKEAATDYLNINPEDFKSKRDYDAELAEIDGKILEIQKENELAERYDLNRQWVEADAKLKVKRNELAKLYAQVDTGVKGLYMKPFFGEDGKMDIKTVYTGVYDKKFFKNDNGEERLLVSYSSTQKPIIGVLLQAARLKKRDKVLPYIFFDDVPMDKAGYSLISKIAEENGLTILTSITGDFSKEKLLDNEMLVEGGEIFFN